MLVKRDYLYQITNEKQNETPIFRHPEAKVENI